MEQEFTTFEIYESLQERLATARSMALMGDQQNALCVFREARETFIEFKETLACVPGFLALLKSTEETLAWLQEEQNAPLHFAEKREEPSKPAKRRVRKAA